MTFTIFGEPQGKARPRVTMHGTYTPKKTRDYEKLVQWEYRKQGGKDYGDNPLQIEITANFQIPKSKPRKVRVDMLAGKIRPAKKPDCDNIAKAILDALNGIAYHDDSQVVCLWIEKWYVPDEPCVIVTIKDLGGIPE